MKYLLPVIFVLAGFLPVQAQVANEVKLVRPGVYKVTYTGTPEVIFKGYVYEREGKMTRDGMWTVYRHGKRVQKIKYDNGKQIWIKLENGKRLTREQIQLRNLQRRVIELERQLARID